MPQDNMRHNASELTPGVATPIISTPKNLNNTANMGFKTTCNTMLTKPTLDVATPSSTCGRKVPNEAKSIIGKPCDMTPVSIR